MESISEIIQMIARQRGRGDAQPLLALLPVEGAPGERIAHLPIEADLAQAWVALTGEPFRPHQAHALTALRRGEHVALRASSPDVALTAHLLLYATLLADQSATALVIAPDVAAVHEARSRIAHINQDLPRSLNLTTALLDPSRRPDLYARVVIATPAEAHGRLLRHHDRAWRLFWPRLRLVTLPDIHRYAGIATAHLADLLLRIQRIAASHSAGQVPSLLATLADVVGAEDALAGLLGQPWRVIPADDGPRRASTLAVWRGGAGWVRDVVEIATAVQRQGYQTHIFCQPLERATLAPLAGDLPRVTFGFSLAPGQVLVAAGYPRSHSEVRRMLYAGYQAVVLVLGEQPHEQALARRAAALLTDPAPAWAPPPPNAYVLAKHVLCAASEQPLTEAEVVAWGVQDIVSRLVAQGQLVDLPDPEVAWKPTDAAGDPYEDWSLRSSGGEASVIRTDQAQTVGAVEPANYERWAFPNAALPPGVGGLRVHARDDEGGTITVRLESGMRRTYPLRRCEVTVREVRENRTLPGSRMIGWGRVLVSEEIYGYREMAGGAAPADVALKPALMARWTAPACWFDLPAAVQVMGQFIGWSLAAALPLRALADFTDTVPCYDHEAHRIYLVDAQPGGSGLALWAYEHAEDLLPLAYDVAYACRNDPLLEPLSRVDMDWLLALLGPQTVEQRQQERPRAVEPARQVEYIAGPPPESPRVITTPPREDRRPSGDQPDMSDRPPPADASEQRPAPVRQPDERKALDIPPAPRLPEPADLEPVPPARQEPEDDLAPPRRGSARSRHGRRPPERPAPARPPRREDSRAEPMREPPDPPAEPARASPSERSGPRRPAASAPEPARVSPPEPADPPARSAPPPDEAAPDATALIERLRRQRQQREAQQGQGGASGARNGKPSQGADAAPVEQRFAAGDRVFCLPYGDGTVQSSRAEDGRELLLVAFPDYGELTVDPAVSLVRKLESTEPDDDDLL